MRSGILYIDKKKGAHTYTFSGQGELYDLGKIKAPPSRDSCQASCGIEEFLRLQSKEEKMGKGLMDLQEVRKKVPKFLSGKSLREKVKRRRQ